MLQVEDQLIQDLRLQVVDGVPQLMRVSPQVLEHEESGHKLTEQEVVRGVQRPEAPEGVVVGVLAEAKRSFCRLPARRQRTMMMMTRSPWERRMQEEEEEMIKFS